MKKNLLPKFRSLIYGKRVPRVQVYIHVGTNPRWLELPLTGTNFHGPRLFEQLYCMLLRILTVYIRYRLLLLSSYNC